MRKTILATLLGCLTMFGLDTTVPAAKEAVPPSRDLTALVHGNNTFALDLYSRLAQDGNTFFSPYSISSALAMTYVGAGGPTAEEMKTVLRFGLEKERLHAAWSDLIRQLQGANKLRKYELAVANRLFGQRGFHFLPGFVKVGQDSYGAGLEEVDFATATEEARKTINAWVEKQTKNKIQELLKPGILDADSRLVLANAIYFKAAWQSPFEPSATQQADFTLADGSKVKVPMMQGTEGAGFLDGGDFSLLALPYENGQLSIIALLPKKADGLPALEKRLTAENLKLWLSKADGQRVHVKMPKFKLTSEFELGKVLKAMGMKEAFTPKADFSGMTTQDRLFIGAVVHKAFIDVNEAGTEAAAATAVVMKRGAAPMEPAVFHADHPFSYLIRDNATGSILFMGRVMNPKG